MKLHITREQFNELSDEEESIYLKKVERLDCFYPSIGEMIKFLEDDLTCIEGGWYVELSGFEIGATKFNKSLCDALWDAVKYKLNK